MIKYKSHVRHNLVIIFVISRWDRPQAIKYKQNCVKTEVLKHRIFLEFVLKVVQLTISIRNAMGSIPDGFFEV